MSTVSYRSQNGIILFDFVWLLYCPVSESVTQKLLFSGIKGLVSAGSFFSLHRKIKKDTWRYHDGADLAVVITIAYKSLTAGPDFENRKPLAYVCGVACFFT